MTQFESLRQRMKDLVVGSSSSNNNIFSSFGGNSQDQNQQQLPVIVMGGEGEPPNAEEQKILEKLEQQNKLLEADRKSLKSISSERGSTHGCDVETSRGGDADTTRGGDVDLSCRSHQDDVVDEVEEEKIQLWEDIIRNWQDYIRNKDKKLKEIIRKGIPRSYRKLVWPRLCNIDELHLESTRNNRPLHYCDLLKQSSPNEKVIRRDITRTYPEQEFFQDHQGQNILFNVIKAYSLVDREVGYCQGSAFIAGLLLIHLPEEDSFQVFLSMMHNYGMREMFKKGFEYLGLCMYQFESLLQEHCMELYRHFQHESFHTSAFASSWFLTLMATTFDLNLSSRILDVFISEGLEIIFRIGLTVLLDNKEKLLKMDMEKLLLFVQNECPKFYNANPDLLFEKSYKIVKYNNKKMKKLEKDYIANSKQSKENEDLMEIRSLRTENQLLRQKLETVEQEASNLADKLINDRVHRALEAEERIRMEKDLSIAKRQAARNHNCSKCHQLQGDNMTSSGDNMTSSGDNMTSSGDNMTSQTTGDDYKQLIEEELKKSKNKQVDYEEQLSQYQERCEDLEERNRELTDKSRVVELEGELIAVKLREAEACNAMKELKHQFNSLYNHYQVHMEEMKNKKKSKVGGGGGHHKMALQELQEEIMRMKFRENQLNILNAEHSQRIMELETANDICTSQWRRAEDDRCHLREKCQVNEENKKLFMQQLNDAQSKTISAESKYEETANALRLYEVESAMKIMELENKIKQLEHEKATPNGEEETKLLMTSLEEKILKQQRHIDKLMMTSSNHHGDVTSSSSDTSSTNDDDDLILKLDDDVVV